MSNETSKLRTALEHISDLAGGSAHKKCREISRLANEALAQSDCETTRDVPNIESKDIDHGASIPPSSNDRSVLLGQLHIAATYLNLHDCHVMGEAVRKAAELLAVETPSPLYDDPQARINLLEQALHKYVQHADDCKSAIDTGARFCSCGLDAVMAVGLSVKTSSDPFNQKYGSKPK